MTAKYYRNRGKMSLFEKEKKKYQNNIKDNMDSNKANDKYLLQL